VGKRVGVASSNRTDEDGLRRLAEAAVAIARNSAELEDWGGLPGRTATTELPAGWSEATAAATPEGRGAGDRAVRTAGEGGGGRRRRARVRVVLDRSGGARGRQLPWRRGRSAENRRTAPDGHDGCRGRLGLRRAGRRRRRLDRRRGRGSRGGRQGPCVGQ